MGWSHAIKYELKQVKYKCRKQFGSSNFEGEEESKSFPVAQGDVIDVIIISKQNSSRKTAQVISE